MRTVTASLNRSRSPVLDACGNGHLDGAGLLGHAFAAAAAARHTWDLSTTAAVGAGPLGCEREQTLLEAHAPAASARRAGADLGGRFAAAAVTGGAHVEPLVGDLLDRPTGGFLEAQRQAPLEVPARL
jgi:hypothetical protein